MGGYSRIGPESSARRAKSGAWDSAKPKGRNGAEAGGWNRAKTRSPVFPTSFSHAARIAQNLPTSPSEVTQFRVTLPTAHSETKFLDKLHFPYFELPSRPGSGAENDE